jgi:uncharacterized protein (DUF433 family)
MEPPEALIDRLPDCLHWSPDGEIRVLGHRIGLYHLIYYYKEGYNAEMLLCQYPTLDLELIQQVLDFYGRDRQLVDEYVKEYDADLERFRASYVPGPGVLRIRELMRQRTRTGESS